MKKPTKEPITIRLDVATVAYFKAQSEIHGIAYQKIIRSVLETYASRNKQPSV